jgi:hypothetical protein
MNRIWQITTGDHSACLDVLFDRNPDRSVQRATWGSAAFVFCAARCKELEVSEVKAWLEETGIEHWIEPAGAFTFFEFKSDLDAVAFKLRWV